MLAYAANAPRPTERPSSPHAMLAIVAAHVALVAAVMSAKLDLPDKIVRTPIVVDFLPVENPPPRPIEPEIRTAPPRPSFVPPEPLVFAPPIPSPPIDSGPIRPPNFGEIIGPRTDPPSTDPILPPAPKVAPRLLTSPEHLKPAYPQSKLASGEEALLRLRLSIDEHGRVVAVEPVGSADRIFLNAARRHLISRWRYKPATEDGRAVAIAIVITLRFQLDS
jgi:periplasmic protein TonB